MIGSLIIIMESMHSDSEFVQGMENGGSLKNVSPWLIRMIVRMIRIKFAPRGLISFCFVIISNHRLASLMQLLLLKKKKVQR